MTICTCNARTLASEAAIEGLMMQAKKIKCDVFGLTETRRCNPLNAVYETGEELFLGICDSRSVGGVGVLAKHEYGKEHRLFRTTYDLNRTSADKKMWPNTSFDYLRSSRSNMKLRRRRRSRIFLYGPGEILPRRSCLLQGHNWRFQRQGWPKKNA
ncbi:hypothetical protein RB195_005191 [Necator americanus]|uniref:Uncharacterized protein n=1 Tax=Necator americanus TaxID=51031 RepID=A0ABR1BPW4_NECAM